MSSAEKKNQNRTVQGFLSYVDRDTKMNVSHWCVASVALLDSSSLEASRFLTVVCLPAGSM